MSKLSENTNVLRASDIDILLIVLENMHKLANETHIWIEIRIPSKYTWIHFC